MKKHSVINKWISLVAIATVAFSACKVKDDPGPPSEPTPNSALTFNFTHSVDGQKIIRDSIMYTNLAGNKYSIETLRYLISDIRLDDLQGNFTELNQYHLVDLEDESTWIFSIKDSIKKKNYKAISYYLGFLKDENLNNGNYRDLDEAAWAFPASFDGIPAGGYYTLELTGKYYDVDTIAKPYAIKIGAKKRVETKTSTKYEPNEIINSLETSDFELTKASIDIELRFNVSRIFSNPGGDLKLDLFEVDNDFETDPMATETVSLNARYVLSLGEFVYGSK